MCILDADEFKEFLPIGTFLLKRWSAKAHLNPLRHSIVNRAGLPHIMQIFVTGHRTPAESAILNCGEKSFFPAWFHSGFD
jgi:hypothetical protein